MTASKKPNRTKIILIAIALILMTAFFYMADKAREDQQVAYSYFIKNLSEDNISAVVVSEDLIEFQTKKPLMFHVTPNVKDPELIPELKRKNILLKGVTPEKPSAIWSFLISFGPVLLLLGFFIYMARKDGKSGPGGAGGPFGFGRSKAEIEISKNGPKVLFDDIAGCDEAKHEVAEIVDFLKNPEKFKKVGGRSPKGILMVGPPGTGKTMLAKAIACEANVAFTSISGSDFVEMFVGVGASRVRDLFQRAKKAAPCIIFIDEIDAVGRARGTGVGGGNDEREQTLNQMLVEMDGFEPDAGIVVIAATNRADVLDSALLRPGRFDRHVTVGLPDIKGREQILSVHMRKIPVGPTIDIKKIARGTPGFAGADLANLVNEAALMAARDNSSLVEEVHFNKARDKILMGPEKKSMKLSEQDRSDTAYHEGGHAIAAHLLPNTDPVHKVSIVPRGNALGVTVQLPEEDRFSYGKNRLLDTIAVLLAGRVAEELFTADITTGASNDYERATSIARNMVTKWGMSELGHMVIGETSGSPFGYRSNGGAVLGASEETMKKVDASVEKILSEQYARVTKLLSDNKDVMQALRDKLLEQETIDNEELTKLVAETVAKRTSV